MKNKLYIIFILTTIVACQTKTATDQNNIDEIFENPKAIVEDGIDTIYKDKFHITIKEKSNSGDTFASGLSGISKIENLEMKLKLKGKNQKLDINDKGEIGYIWVPVDTYSLTIITNDKDSVTYPLSLEPLKYNVIVEPVK